MWRIVPPAPVPTLPTGVWVKSATLISDNKNTTRRKNNSIRKHGAIGERPIFAVPKCLHQCTTHNKHNARTVVVAETPTRFVNNRGHLNGRFNS